MTKFLALLLLTFVSSIIFFMYCCFVLISRLEQREDYEQEQK